MNSKLSLAILLTTALFTTPVLASEPAVDNGRIVVSYADLDLRSDQGLSRLDQRIRVAIDKACGTASDSDLKGKNEIRRCRILTHGAVASQRATAVGSSAPILIAAQR